MSFALSLGQIGTSVAPPPAASEAPTDVLLGLFILFVGAKLGEEVARRTGPARRRRGCSAALLSAPMPSDSWFPARPPPSSPSSA